MRFTRLHTHVALVLLLSGIARAADVRVVSSGGFAAAYRTLAPEFEQTDSKFTPNVTPTRSTKSTPSTMSTSAPRLPFLPHAP